MIQERCFNRAKEGADAGNEGWREGGRDGGGEASEIHEATTGALGAALHSAAYVNEIICPFWFG